MTLPRLPCRVTSRKLAVAFVHGVGMPTADFADAMIAMLDAHLAKHAEAAGILPPELEYEPVFWSDVIQAREEELWRRAGGLVKGKEALRFPNTRQFILNYAADTIAYQRTPSNRHVYEAIHAIMAGALKRLAERAGADAPLVVVAHSLGSVIASDYLFNLQAEARDPPGHDLPPSVVEVMGEDPTPLERGETLAALYTLGSPIAIWSLRHHHEDPARDYGTPVKVPSPLLAKHHPALGAPGPGVGWLNLYDRGDVIAYPLQGLNDAYREAVRDVPVKVGNAFASATPLSHTEYWTDKDVVGHVGQGLFDAWRAVNPTTVRVSGEKPRARRRGA